MVSGSAASVAAPSVVAPLWGPPTPENVVQPGQVAIQADPGGMVVAHPQTVPLPSMGKWMYAKDGQPAHWLGMEVQGKALREPINMIFVVANAPSAKEASERLESSLQKAGYGQQNAGHSLGYRAWMGSGYQDQLPTTFSNHYFLFNNNHGRIFGPVQSGGAYIFSAAFSRERVNDVQAVFDHHHMHHFATFNGARDEVAQKLEEQGTFHLAGSVPMQNILSGNPSTMDHDGQATVLVCS